MSQKPGPRLCAKRQPQQYNNAAAANGSTPTTSDFFLFNGDSVFLSGITTLKAIAVKTGYNNSPVATATYNINTGPFVSAGSQQIIFSSRNRS
ncbi:MAG TPA: chitobiase/beta-hexosaminidase C-terminal domain-containing protein [Candidatus Angelobacter sp.]|nr:chitobiase/beta-hexosaminidase C-terminal domain-containing protein [Candidatus Angelobacter sp.]